MSGSVNTEHAVHLAVFLKKLALCASDDAGHATFYIEDNSRLSVDGLNGDPLYLSVDITRTVVLHAAASGLSGFPEVAEIGCNSLQPHVWALSLDINPGIPYALGKLIQHAWDLYEADQGVNP